MPSELRHLLFRPAEVVQAVKEYHRRLGASLPAGTVVRCGPEDGAEGGAVRFRIALAPDPAGATARTRPDEDSYREVVIEGPALAAALILYCRDRRIPLSASAEKSLQRFGEQVCLAATLNPRQDTLPPVGPLRL